MEELQHKSDNKSDGGKSISDFFQYQVFCERDREGKNPLRL
jgi:hypothetical protein